MFCTNCGKEVSGEFCTSCGKPINKNDNIINDNNTTGTLTLFRPSGFLGFAVKLNIMIDGTGSQYQLGAGEKINLELSPGPHKIGYKVWCRKEQFVDINVVSGNNYSVLFVYDWLWGGFKVGKDSKLQ